MAAAILEKPGGHRGSCSIACAHLDCIAARQMAIELCRICNQQIGYNKFFYTEPDNKVHKRCLEDELTRKLKSELPQSETRFFTYEEVAELLRVEVGTVRNWVSQEKIPYRKAGGSILFLLEEILSWTIPPNRKQGRESNLKCSGRLPDIE